jgi:hypothetical protein
MKTTELTDLQQIIALWKEKGITECSMEFNCGGDQMNDYTFTFHTKEGEIKCDELESYFENEVYNQVEFYVNSDGHYMGEAGYVYIRLDEDDEDNVDFTYTKDAESEWNETFSEVAYFPLTDDYKKFIQDKVQSIVGGEDGEAINYKGDCILTDEEEAIADSLQSDLRDFACDVEISDAEGEAGDWFRFSTNNPEDDDADDDTMGVTITDDGLKVSVEKTYYVYKPSED